MAFEQRLKENSVSEAWANYWIFPNDIAKLKISPTILSFLAWDNIYLIGSPEPKLGSGIVIFSKTRSHITGISIDTNWNISVEKTLR